MISEAANVLTAIFTGGTLLLAYWAFRAQENSAKPALFVQVLPYDNALSIAVSVRNRQDHPMQVTALECLSPNVKLAHWQSMGDMFVMSIDQPRVRVEIERALSSKGQDDDQALIFDGVLVSEHKLPSAIKLKLYYDALGDGRIATMTRIVPLSVEARTLALPDVPPKILPD